MSSNNKNNNNKRRKTVKSFADKEKRSDNAKKKKEMLQFRGFLTEAKLDINFWTSPYCKDLHEFYSYAVSHLEHFPLAPNDSPLVDAQDPLPSLDSIPKLSEGFIEQSVLRRDVHEDPVVGVLSCSIEYEGSGYHKNHPQNKRARLLLWDGSDKVCLGVTASNLLCTVKTQLTKGQPIIRLKNYNATEYTDKSKNDVSCGKPGIVIVQCQFLCRPALDVNPNDFSQAYMSDEDHGDGAHDGRASVDAVRSLENPTTDFHHWITEFQKW